MSFILIPERGGGVKINAWNWRPTRMLLRDAKLMYKDSYERMGQGCGGRRADAETSARIADSLGRQLRDLQPGQRIRADLTITHQPKKRVVFRPGMNVKDVDANELDSATYEWLVKFRDLCRASGGFSIS
jgi:hypothetical protein